VTGPDPARAAAARVRPDSDWQVDEPVRQGLAELASRLLGGADLELLLVRHAEAARRIVPALVGVSMTVIHHGVALTAATTHDDLRPLDEVQYAAGEGPCLAATRSGSPVGLPDLTDEQRWQAFASQASAAGIASSLSLPVATSGGISLGVNLYAGAPQAFSGREDELIELFGGGGGTSVHNADLGHSTRTLSAELPAAVADVTAIDQAVGVLVATQHCSPERALVALHASSAELGYDLPDMARRVVRSMSGADADEGAG
jgi:GAF domain-containing protein